MSLRFHPAAEAEFSNAIQYYEDVEPGLGQDFAVEVYSAVQRTYPYTNCGATVTLDDQSNTLPPCPRCHQTNYTP